MSADDFEKHIRVVVRGRKKSLSTAIRSDDDSLAEDFFRALSDSDVEGALTSLEYDYDADSRQHSAKLLIAYFDWCSHVGKDTVSGRPLREFVEQLAWIMVREMCGRTGDDATGDSYQLPHWHSPDVALGWRRPKWRPRDETLYEIGTRVAVYVELMSRKGCTVAEAKRRAAAHFSRPGRTYSTSWIEKRMKESSLPPKSLKEQSMDELRDALRELSGE